MADNSTTAEQEIILKGLSDSVIRGSPEEAKGFAEQSIKAGVPPVTALEEGLTVGIREVGDRFGRGEAYLPEMVLGAEAMQAGIAVLEPYLGEEGTMKKGKILIGSVQGDIHDIGKNIAAALLSVNGFEVTDIGRDVTPTGFLDALAANEVDIIGMSCLLTTSLPYMAETIELLEEEGLRQKYRVIIGGGPTNQAYATKIGADGYAATAADGVKLCENLLRAAA